MEITSVRSVLEKGFAQETGTAGELPRENTATSDLSPPAAIDNVQRVIQVTKVTWLL